ncbi:MAG: hypothetical protein ACYDFV_06635 [Vulcanimicrobiaceae bacterium]
MDTLAIAQKLRKAGVEPAASAEAIAEAIGFAAKENTVTKQDLLLVEQRLEAKITGVEERLGARITSVEERLDAKITSVEDRLDAKITSVEERLDAKITSVEERLDAKITSVEDRLGAQISKSTLTLFIALTGVIVIATGLLAVILHR